MLFTDRVDKHPVLYGILVKHFLVADVVLEPVFLVALDIDSEHILNGILMPVECAAGQAYSLAHLGFQPLPVDFPERDSVRPMNDVHKPDIFLKQCVGSHNEGFCKYNHLLYHKSSLNNTFVKLTQTDY